jgi:hypothetical protein
LHPDVEVRPSPIEGVGLFARADLCVGTPISRLAGQVVTTSGLRDLFARASSYVDTLQVGPDQHLVLAPGSPNGKGNHSCDPNLWWSGPTTDGRSASSRAPTDGRSASSRATLVARRDIAAGEELTNDYATSTTSPDFVMECACGTALCRGVVTGDDWRLTELRDRYGSHWSFPG